MSNAETLDRPDIAEAPLPAVASLRARIAALEPGETIALARRFALAEATPTALTDAANGLERTARPAMARAKASSGHAYTGEATECFTTKRDPVVLYLITRTE